MTLTVETLRILTQIVTGFLRVADLLQRPLTTVDSTGERNTLRRMEECSHEAENSDLLLRRHFEQEIIILCVRWYLRYKLSYRDLVEMMAERGLSVAHTTILRWVQRYAPEFVKRWSRFSTSTGTSWRVDETYVRIRGQWAYLYRAVDASGKTVDFRLSTRRNVASAKAFFRKAVRSQARSPETITLDGYAASHRAVRELQQRQTCQTDEASLVKVPEQSHRAGPSQCEVQAGCHAGPEKLRFCRDDNPRRRAYASHSQRAVQLRCFGHSGANYVRNLGSCACCMSCLGI
jgi:transposase-like protein